ncbi:unnamed protein product [Tuber melanosporum]|uniref:(Perigord truffle) hypothetical protein n=1 Tax=Tuber melanosporum (strain Mel28) TaxID=656061 RepID=D5G660_TUBMM|nr:uncharacterized protein GSTUM_00001784001 [Tuber melanosporum]CAZ80003.1 unnamed protein product [Tuber melanosporum]
MRGYSYLDLAPRENDEVLWLKGWKGSYNNGSKHNASLREAVELLLEDGVGSYNLKLGHLFQSDSRRGVPFPIRKFQDLIEALVNIGISVGCLRSGIRPISNFLEAAYMDRRSFFRHNATIPEAVRFLTIGHRLRSRQMIQDFMFIVLSGFEVAFPKSRVDDGADPRLGIQRSCPGMDRDLWEYLKNQHSEYQHRKRKRERQLRDYFATMGKSSDNSIFLSVRPSALIDLVSSASTSVKSRTQPWEMQSLRKRDQVVVEVKTVGNNNDPRRAQRDPNREHERRHERGQFEHILARYMDRFAQEERQRRYDNILPWEVHLHGGGRRLERGEDDI